MTQTANREKAQPTHGGARPGAGRHPVPEKQKQKRRTLRFSDDQWNALGEMAETEGLGVSGFVRMRLGLEPETVPAVVCESCKGTGNVKGSPCGDCNGMGYFVVNITEESKD